MATKHTPTPYKIAPRKNYYLCEPTAEEKAICELNNIPLRFHALSIGKGANGPTICIVPLDESSEENAKFIVRACNSHDNLIKALENGLQYMTGPSYLQAIDVLNEALGKV